LADTAVKTGSEPGFRDPPFAGSRFAAADVGSHTVRLLIAHLDADGRRISPLRCERRITRLARGFEAHRLLGSAAIRDTIQALEEYSGYLDRHHVSLTACGATGVVRRARNQQDLLDEICRRTRFEPRVVSERDEALLSAKGMLSALPEPGGPILGFDLGGGSIEFVLLAAPTFEPLWMESVFAGAASVTERFVAAAPTPRAAMAEARRFISRELNPCLRRAMELLPPSLTNSPPLQLLGTAGTVTTLAAMRLAMVEYQPYRVNGLELSIEWLNRIIDRLANLSIPARRDIPGLEPGREDIILGGALIVREVVEILSMDRLMVTDAGLLEGLVTELVERHLGLPESLRTPLTWKWQKS
jgi:exopolyphosphatase/guanosine-5'-triphosphate,3'-diphosphate pyrophosphatase